MTLRRTSAIRDLRDAGELAVLRFRSFILFRKFVFFFFLFYFFIIYCRYIPRLDLPRNFNAILFLTKRLDATRNRDYREQRSLLRGHACCGLFYMYNMYTVIVSRHTQIRSSADIYIYIYASFTILKNRQASCLFIFYFILH